MAMAAIVACALFGAVCGSSVATAATLAQVALPEMRRLQYSGRLATATLAVGGTLGILIPPSVPLVVYAILTEQNIAKLFLAAFIPGIIATIGYCLAIAIVVARRPELGPAQPRSTRIQRRRSFVEIWPVGAVFAVVFGGIYGGAFTPTEGAAVGAVGTFVAALLRRELDARGIARCFLGTAVTAGMIFMVFLGADMLNGALALSQIPHLGFSAGHIAVPVPGHQPVSGAAAVLAWIARLRRPRRAPGTGFLCQSSTVARQTGAGWPYN